MSAQMLEQAELYFMAYHTIIVRGGLFIVNAEYNCPLCLYYTKPYSVLRI